MFKFISSYLPIRKEKKSVKQVILVSFTIHLNVDSIIIPARVHPNNGPVTIYVPAIPLIGKAFYIVPLSHVF